MGKSILNFFLFSCLLVDEFLLFFLETGSYHVALAGLELTMQIYLSCLHSAYLRHVPPRLTKKILMKSWKDLRANTLALKEEGW